VVYHIKSEGEEGDFNFQLSFTGVGVIEVSSNIT